MQTGANQGGALSTNGGAEGNVQNQDTDNKPKVVDYEDHERALKDLHKFKQSYKQTETRMKELEKQLQEQESQKLKEKEDWKTLAEKRLERATELEQKLEKVTNNIFSNRKYDEVRAEALRAGLRPEAEDDLRLLSLEPVVVEATTEGRFLVNGAKEFVEDLKRTRKHWFKLGGVPDVNTGSSSYTTQSSTVSIQELGKLENEFRKKPTAENKQKWQEALVKYRKTKT